MKWMLLAAAVSLALPQIALAQGSARDAGIVSARIPPAEDMRGKQKLPVEKDMKVLWNDRIVTDKGGRVRVRLNDGSILNVGSQSALTIEAHDASTQRTALQLAYGRMRASVVRVTNPSAGGFQVRSNAAVAGVVGTDIYNETSEIHSTIIALGGGDVRVTSPNPAYADFVALLTPGEAITLIADQRPGQKRLATQEELGTAYSETDTDEVVNLAPRAAYPGETLQGRIVGKGIASATAVSFAREGLSAQITGPAANNGIPVSVTVAANVPHGTYPFTVQRLEGLQIGILIVTSQEEARRMATAGAAAGEMHPPAAQNITATRGAKFILDASATQTPAGTSIAAYLWKLGAAGTEIIPGEAEKLQGVRFNSKEEKFAVNTSLLAPGSYLIQLVVVNDRGQVATQRYNLTVEPGLQPAEIIRDLAAGYESLQPNQFLKHFDEERFRNFSGFAAAIDDSFRNQLETVRVFQRPVNCTISEEQDQAVCQVDFEVTFTKKDQPAELLDASGNPFPPGVVAPPGTSFAKRLLKGTERSTVRFERADKGWKITDYAAEVSCPGGSQVSGLNVGSCILAIGTFSTPGFTVINGVINTSSGSFSFTGLSSPLSLPIGGTLTGTFDVSPLGGFNGSVDFSSSSGSVLGTPVTATFSPNPAPAGTTVTFTITAPTTAPSGFTGSAPFTFTINGVDTSGSITQTISLNLVLTSPAAALTISQFTSPTAPLTLLANSSAVIGITATCTGSTSTCASLPPVTITFGPLPAGVTVSPSTATIPAGSTQPFTFSFTPTGNTFANFGTANVTVTGTSGGATVLSTTIVLNLGTAGSLPFTLFASPSTQSITLTGTSQQTTSFNVFVSSQQTFNQPINITVGAPPPGVTISPSTFVFTPGLSGTNVFYSVTVDPTIATPGSYPVLISGVSGGVSTTTTWTLNINGAFSLSVTPNNTFLTPMVLPPDGVTQNTVTVTVTSINNFVGSVTVVFSNPFPSGVTVTPGASQTIALTAGGTANAVFTLVAASGTTNTSTIQARVDASSSTGAPVNSPVFLPFMTIGPAGFALSPTSSSTTVDINSSFAPTLITTVQPLGNFSASVNFVVNSGTVPAGVTVSPATQTVAAGGQARFTIRAATPAVVGNFTIQVNAVSGNITQPFNMNIRLRGQITLNVTQSPGGGPPGTQTVPLVLAPSGTLTFTVSVGGIDGFSGSTQLQVFSLPSGVTGTFASSGTSIATVNAPGSDTLTLTNTGAASQPLITSGVFAQDSINFFSSNSPSQQIYYTTGSPSFVLGCVFFTGLRAQPCNQTNYLNININQAGSSGQLQLQVDSVGGYSGSVSVTPVNMPTGMTMSPNPVILAPGVPTTVTFTAVTPAVAGRWSGFSLVGNDTVTPTLASSTPVDGQLNGSLLLSVSPATTQNTPAIIAPGGSQTFTVNISGQNGFSGTANLNFFPSLATGASSNPPCCNIQVTVPPTGSVTATVTINVAANSPSSFSEPISFSATGFDVNFNSDTYFINGQTNASSFYVVGPSSFSTAVFNDQSLFQPNTLSTPKFVQVGQQTSLFAAITAIGAFSGTVFLDVTGLPCMSVSSAPGTSATIPVRAGAGYVVIQPQIAGVGVQGASVTSTLFFTASSSCSRGFVQGTLTATSGALVQSIPLAFFITPQVSLVLTPSASTTAPMIIAPGSSAQLQIAANPTPSFAGDVDIAFSLPQGVTITPNSTKVTLGGFSTVTVNLASSVSVGSSLTVFITATINGNLVAQTTATILAGSGAFGIAIVPSNATSSTTPLVINAGSSGQIGVAVSAIGAFSGSVTINASFTVTTLSTPTPTLTVTPGNTANFTVDAAAGAQGLIARMFINATGGGQSASAIVYISIGSGGFSLSVSGNSNSSPLIGDIGSSTSFTVLVHQQASFTGTVSLSASGLPAGVTVPNNNFLVPAGTGQTFQLQIASSAQAGDFQFTVTGTSGTLPAVNLTVFLRLRGQFSLAVTGGATSGNPLVVAPGSSQTVSVDIVPVASFFGSALVSTSIFNLPSGVTVTPSSATASPGAPAVFTVAAAAGTPATNVFNFSVFASATYASTFPSAPVFVTVAGNPTFNLSLPSQLDVDIGNQFGSSVLVQLSPVGGFAATVTLTVNTSQLPSGVTVNLPSSTFLLSGSNTCPNTGQIGRCVNLNFIASTNVTNAGTANVDITATSGNISITQTLQLQLLANFNITVSPTSTSTNPILLPTSGSQNFTLTMTTTPPNVTCNGQPFTAALAITSTQPTGVTATISPTVTTATPATATVTTNNAPASGVFSVFGNATPPAGCSVSGGSGTVGFFSIGPPSFTLSVPSFQTGVNINSNSLSSVNVSVAAVGSFAGTVNISVVAGSVPAGVTVTPATAAVTPGNSLTFQVRADSPATAGNASFNITATDGTTTLNGTIPLLLRGSYTLTITPANSSSAPAVVAPGQSKTYSVSVTAQNGFTGTVNFFGVCCSSPPPGVTVTTSFTATPTSPGTITVSAVSTAVASQPQGVFICSSSTNSFSSPCFSLFSAVGPAGFSVTNFTSPSFPQQMVINGSPRTVGVSVQSLGGFSGTVNLALGTLVPGLSASPQTAQVTVPAGGSASFTFSFQAGSTLTQGPVDVQLTASQGTTTVNTFFYLYAASNMALVQSPVTSSTAPLQLLNGDPVGHTVSIQVLAQGGFSGSVPLSVVSVPSGMTVTPMTATAVCTAGNCPPVNFQFTAQTASTGFNSVDISASFSGLSASTIVFFNVGVGSYAMSTTPASSSTAPISLDPNGTTIVPIAVSIIPQNGFVGTVDITPTGLPSGVTVNPTTAQVVITSASTGTTTFNFSATVAQGLTPVQVTFNATANVATPIGPVAVNNSDTSFLLVNPPTFALTQTGGTSSAPLSIEQGIPPGATFQIGVTGTGTVAISFANVPSGVNISPPTANIAAGSSATFTVDALASAAIGNYIISVVGTSSGQTIALNLFVNVVVPTNGFFLSTNPPTSSAAPVILQPDHTLVTFLDVNVQQKGTFTGIVTLTLAGVPTGVTATLTPSSADLSLSPSQVVQLQFQTTTGLAAFGPVAVTVTGTSGTLTANTPVWIALQTVSAIKNGGMSSGGMAPDITQVLPKVGNAGSHMLITLQGSGLSAITDVMSSTTKVSARMEPVGAGSDTMRRMNVFARPDTPQGTHTLMLISPRGSVPVGIIIQSQITDTVEGDGTGRGARNIRLGNQAGGVRAGRRVPDAEADAEDGGGTLPVITRIEPATLKPGQVVEGTIYGENLQDARGVRAAGLGVSIEIVEAHATELKVRFNVASAAASGSRMLSLTPVGGSTEVMLNIQADRVAAPARATATSAQAAGTNNTGDVADADGDSSRRGARSQAGATTAAASPADLVVQPSDISMSPGSPRPGDSVTFRVQVRNRGGQGANDVEFEFTLSGANVRVRDRFNIAAGGSQSFQVQWQAAGSGRFEPRVAIDPDRRLNFNRASTEAAMPAFEMSAAGGPAGRGIAAVRERGQLSLAANGCQGFRFSSGTEQACNGGADFEVRMAPQGGALRIEADGVRNLGATSFDSPAAEQAARGAMGTSETVLPGATYLVQTRRGAVLVRVMDIRGLNSVRAAAPRAMQRPGLADVEESRATKSQNDITVVIEWRVLAQ